MTSISLQNFRFHLEAKEPLRRAKPAGSGLYLCCSLTLLINRRLVRHFDAEQMAEVAKVRDPAACHLIARICRFFLLSILAQELVEKILNFPQVHAEGEVLQRRGGFMEFFERRERWFR